MPTPVFSSAASLYAYAGLKISALCQCISNYISDFCFIKMLFGEGYLLSSGTYRHLKAPLCLRMSVLLRVSSMRDEEIELKSS